MKTLLTTAIEERRLVHLLYDGKSRTLEPHALGKNGQNEDVLLGRQIKPWLPEGQSWQVFRLSRIYGLLVLDSRMETPPGSAEVPAEALAGIRLTA